MIFFLLINKMLAKEITIVIKITEIPIAELSVMVVVSEGISGQSLGSFGSVEASISTLSR